MRGVGVGRGVANSASSAVTLLLLWLLPGVQVDFLSPSAGPQAVTGSQGPPPPKLVPLRLALVQPRAKLPCHLHSHVVC